MTIKKDFATRIRQQLLECAGWDSDQISADRKRAIDYYYQRPRGDEVRGRSNVVSGDVSAMVEANLAQMMDSFSSEYIAEFDALGIDDDDQAALESVTVAQMIMRDNNGYNEIGTAVKDGLLLRNGIMKCWTDENRESRTLTLRNFTAEAYAEMQQAPGLEAELLEYNESEQTARVRVTRIVRKFRAESVAPENFLYTKDWHKIDLQEIPICAERHIEPRSELYRAGFPASKVAKLKAFHNDVKLDALARNVREYGDNRHGIDKSQDLIEWFEVYVLVDSGNGTSERHRVALAGVNQDSILEDEPVSHVPFASGSPFINPHRFTGISIYDKLRQTQDLNTGLQRALMDNANTAIKNRLAYLDGKVNADDLADGRVNGTLRVRSSVGDIRTALMPFNQPDLSGGLLSNLEYQRQVRTELGGASLELAAGQMQMAGGRIGSEGVDRAFSVMEQLASHMTKNMATSLVRNTFLLAHMVIRENFDTPVNVKRNGRWESPVPSEWQARTRVTTKIGMSPGERARKVAAIREVVNQQFQLANMNMDDVLVDIGGFYRALTDLARTQELPNPEQYFVDPETEAAKKALQAKTEGEQKAAAEQKALMGQAIGLEQLRTAFDKYKADQETEFKYWRETLQAEIAEAEIAGKATADLIKQTTFSGAKTNGAKSSGDTKPNRVRQPGADERGRG